MQSVFVTLAVNGCEHINIQSIGDINTHHLGCFFLEKNNTFRNSITANQYFLGVAFNDVMMFVFIFFAALGTVLIFEWTVLENIYQTMNNSILILMVVEESLG